MTPKHLTIDGRTCLLVAPGVLLRDDGMVGSYQHKHTAEPSPDDVTLWVSIPDLARMASPLGPDGMPISRLQLTPATIKARLRDRWGWADLRKPAGWERVVDAKRNGITWDGQTLSIAQWAQRIGITTNGLVRRLADPHKTLANVMHSGDFRTANAGPRTTPTPSELLGLTPFTPRLHPNAKIPDAPVLNAQGGLGGVFRYKDHVGTLADHCRREKKNYNTVRARLKLGVPWPKAIEMKRKVRSDYGLSNPRRSIYSWDPGFVSKREARKLQAQAALAVVETYDPAERPIAPRPTVQTLESARSSADLSAFDVSDLAPDTPPNTP